MELWAGFLLLQWLSSGGSIHYQINPLFGLPLPLSAISCSCLSFSFLITLKEHGVWEYGLCKSRYPNRWKKTAELRTEKNPFPLATLAWERLGSSGLNVSSCEPRIN